METNQTAVIRAEVDPELKSAFEAWWRANGYRTEAEALREHIRTVTKFGAKSQEKNPQE